MAEKQVRTLHGWTVTGRLYDSEFEEQLDSLMVEAKMSYRNQSNGDILIYAGWTPEYDPSGGYVISVLRGCEYERPSVFTNTIEEAEKTIVDLMCAYSDDIIVVDTFAPRRGVRQLSKQNASGWGSSPSMNVRIFDGQSRLQHYLQPN